MNVDSIIRDEKESLQYWIDRYNGKLKTLEQYRTTLESLSEKADVSIYPDRIHIYPDRIHITNLNRESTIKALKAFGGKWEKIKYPDMEGSEHIQYRQEIDSVLITIEGEPPQSCRIVEEEVTIPAQMVPEKKIKVKKIFCTEKEEEENEKM